MDFSHKEGIIKKLIGNRKPWMTNEILQMIIEKQKLYLNRVNNELNLEDSIKYYNFYCSILKNIIIAFELEYESKLFMNHCIDSKQE